MALTLTVRLRHGRYDAGDMRPSQAEWPPHPARLFCALAASAVETDDWDALRWLERAGTPTVRAAMDDVRPGRTDSYVVTNQTEQKPGSQSWPGRTNGARSRAFVTPACDRFAVVWPGADPDPEVLARLGALARRVPYVGRSTSQAEVSVTGSLPEDEPAWSELAPVPLGTPGAIELRVPYAGYTDALQDAYDRGGRAWEAARALPYSPVVATPEPVPTHLSPWDDLIIWGFERPSARINGDQMARLTLALRKAVISRVTDPVPAQVSGHGADDRTHVAFLALPDVDQPHSDGHLLGVALALPRHMPAEDWTLLAKAVMADPLTRLTPWSGEPVRLGQGQNLRTLRRGRWTGHRAGTRTWVTATPMMTDSFARPGRSYEQMVAKSLRRAGFPDVTEVEVSTAPLTGGAIWRPRPGSLPPNRPKKPIVHARVTFDRPVVGPVIAGSMRYLGLGLFVPEGVPG
ncbi:type I-U CRISPR-associated protein Csb2 [Streptosporangium amethystogenes subsp. fukuiense]|uniref:Type I-U CRISPR-associated protein Csb2 n=1 Tax=Streptosporangium amethystogenes subsp. fukuiense TaxID=698418 RepID=A0ABW2T229_9ACTN